MTEKLKPCPFCGGKVTIRYSTESQKCAVQCYGCCMVAFVGESGEDMEGTIRAWNTRAERTAEIVEERAKFGTETVMVRICSGCGSRLQRKTPYCPYCGAKVAE